MRIKLNSFKGRESSDLTAINKSIDLVGTFISMNGLNISQMLHGSVFQKNSITTHGLSGKLANFSSNSSALCFSHSNSADGSLALIIQLRYPNAKKDGTLDKRQHFNQLGLDKLELSNGFLELNTLTGVCHCCFKGSGCHTSGNPCHRDPRMQQSLLGATREIGGQRQSVFFGYEYVFQENVSILYDSKSILILNFGS